MFECLMKIGKLEATRAILVAGEIAAARTFARAAIVAAADAGKLPAGWTIIFGRLFQWDGRSWCSCW